MTKTVFSDTASVSHRWAHQTQDSARYRDNWSFSGRLLSSYSTVVGLRARRPDQSKTRIGEPVAFLTATNYSMTTSKHMGSAWQATRGMERYAVPDLDFLIREGLEFLAIEWEAGRSTTLARRINAKPEGFRYWTAESARKAVAKWLASNVAAIRANKPDDWREAGDIGGLAAILAEMAGYTAKQLAAILDKAERDHAERERKAAKAEHDRRVRDGKAMAALPDSEFRELWPADGKDSRPESYEAKQGAEFSKRLARLHKAAKAEGLKLATAELWRKVKLYREHFNGREARITAAYRADLAAKVRAWRRGEGEPPEAYLFPAFSAIKGGLERAQAREFAERHAAAFAAWQAGEAARPYSNSYDVDSPERAAILADVERERAAFLADFAAWQANEGERPAKASGEVVPPYGKDGYAELSAANRAIAYDVECEAREARETAERQREAERFALAEDARRAWLAGERDSGYVPGVGNVSDETGGALIRATGVERDSAGAIVGGSLETSHGVDVPLCHAIKAFRFVKLIRERGETWRRNGRTVRVGHYQIDCVDSGGFTAGCHRINWPEIERLARELGVYDLPADDSATQSSAVAA